MKKKIIGSVLVLGIVAAAAGLFVPNAVQKITKESVITSSQLEKAVDITVHGRVHIQRDRRQVQ